jgi:SAM-dependent methyltransferase
MLPLWLRRKIHDSQEGRGIIRAARARIGELIGNDRVIEIGCGFGPNADYCKGAYLGIDISPDAIREAQRRHPARAFICGGVDTVTDKASGYDVVLLCAVLHEIPDYVGALNAVAESGIRRIVICDYDPELRGWLRLWMGVFEPAARRWWGCRPSLLLPGPEWSIRNGSITRSLPWWEFRR